MYAIILLAASAEIRGNFNQNIVVGNNIVLRQGSDVPVVGSTSPANSSSTSSADLAVPPASDDLLRNGEVSVTVEASSEYPTESGAYAKEHVYDGRLDTEWSSNLEGENASITFHFSEQVYATSICLRQRMMHDDQSLMSGLLIDYLDGGYNDTMTLENVEDPVASAAYRAVTTFPNGWSWGVQAETCFTYSPPTSRVFSSIRLSATGMLAPTIPNSGFNEIQIFGGRVASLTQPDSYICTNPTGRRDYAGHGKRYQTMELFGTDICASAAAIYENMYIGGSDVTCGPDGQAVLGAISRILGYEKAVRDGLNECTLDRSTVFQWTREGLEAAQRIEDTHINTTFSEERFAVMVQGLHYIYNIHIPFINGFKPCTDRHGTAYYTSAMWVSNENRSIDVQHNPRDVSEPYWNARAAALGSVRPTPPPSPPSSGYIM